MINDSVAAAMLRIEQVVARVEGRGWGQIDV